MIIFDFFQSKKTLTVLILEKSATSYISCYLKKNNTEYTIEMLDGMDISEFTEKGLDFIDGIKLPTSSAVRTFDLMKTNNHFSTHRRTLLEIIKTTTEYFTGRKL